MINLSSISVVTTAYLANAHNPLTNPTPHKSAYTPHDKAKPTSEPLEYQAMHTTNHCLDMSPILDLELPASPTSDGKTHHHLEDSEQGDSLLVACMSQRWHNGRHLCLESDEDSDGDDAEGSGAAQGVPAQAHAFAPEVQENHDALFGYGAQFPTADPPKAFPSIRPVNTRVNVLRNLAGHYLNDPDTLINMVWIEPGPGGCVRVWIVLKLANIF
ncbi:hypothetical protein BJY52DRAFT_1232222 [Lactarius psammicola]|nr:hypothetical protein BJY52DRAFT_1232222 [Lactarius psammicola]